MAKVKITGHASGTGVLTVTAPNTSTDRTITLPDGTGTLIADNGSGKVGVGTASPQNVLHVASGDSSNDNYRTGADTPLIVEGTTSSYIQFVADNNAPMGILMGNSSDSALGGVTYDDNNGQLRIKTNGSTRARFTNDGLCFNDDTAAANALDDYEEGTWTPSVGGNASYNTQVGKYTKIGNMVTVVCNQYVNTLGTGSASQISGLPFAVSNITEYNANGSGHVSHCAGLAQNVASITPSPMKSATTIRFFYIAAGGGNTNGVNSSVFQNGTDMYFTLTYRTDS